MSLIEAAHGVAKIADARMAAVVGDTLQRGYDPRDFTLIAFGGGGRCARRRLRASCASRVCHPPQPGHFSALRMLWTDLRHDWYRPRRAA